MRSLPFTLETPVPATAGRFKCASDTVSRDNGDAGLDADDPTTAKVSIETSRWENNAFGVAISGGRAAISDSVFFGSPFQACW